MRFRYSLELLTLAALLLAGGFFLFASSVLEEPGFTGTDVAGTHLIRQLTGKPEAGFEPIVPQWKPPSAEIEATLFGLQAAVGGILVGGVFGYWIGQKSR